MKKFIVWIFSLSVLVMFTACRSLEPCNGQLSGETLMIGWGERSIAKEGPFPITGQFSLRISQGQYSPVLASALAVSKGEEAAIFVSVDMVSFHPKALKKVYEFLNAEQPEIPVEKIILNSTHTHAGPSANDIAADYPRRVEVISSSEMQTWIARQVADAIKDAWAKRAPGSIAYGYGFATTGHSRRTIYLVDKGKTESNAAGTAVNGHGKMYGRTNDPDFDCYEAGTDAFINLMYTFDRRGRLTNASIVF